MRSFSNRASSPPVSRKTTNDRPASHRKTTNDSSGVGRSKSVVSRRTTSGSKERGRSKDRKSTALSGNSSGRTGRSGASEDDESEDSEVDVENVPFHLRKAVPLHLVEARILKKSEKGQPSSPTVAKDIRRRVAHNNAESDFEEKAPNEIYDPAPVEAVMVRKRVIILLLAGFCVWCAAMLPLLVVHVLTFYLSLGVQTHRAHADAIFGKLEASIAQELTPALNLVYMLSVQANMGLFNVSEPYSAITRALLYTIQESKQMQYVKVVGAAEQMLVFRPGNLHYVPKDEDGDGLIDVLINPDQMTGTVDVVSDSACKDVDPFFCLDVDLSKLRMVALPSRQVTASWLGPEFLQISKQNELVADPTDWPLIIRFLAHLNVTEGLPSRTDPNIVDPFGIPIVLPARVGLDIGLGVDQMANVLEDVRPEGGDIFIFTVDGSIVAGTGWEATPAVQDGVLQYQKIWEMPFEWAADLTPEAVAGERMELMTSVSDLVVMKPLGESLAEGDDVADSEYLGAAIEATSKVALRVLVVVPLDAAVAPLLTLLVDAAMGVIIAPFATLALVCIVATLIALVKFCRDRCSPVEEEDPYLWRFEDQDDE
mmetsp:Transcript_78577/g.124002  ORF Transcript_78577/g.124002 Transcript_78577/m.124002 type:complete len:597 (+) Transcript_78577:44-1834(+)